MIVTLIVTIIEVTNTLGVEVIHVPSELEPLPLPLSAETTVNVSAKVKTPKTENKSTKIIKDLPKFTNIPPYFSPVYFFLDYV
ncbi:MAG TPA: hypothetical protein VMC48_06650 [Methanobacterium sp.]|nr:hypothetical protein [Methanobacterium sp.]